MPKSMIPNPLERRHLVEKDLNADRALAIAEAYLAGGRVVEAVDFLHKAGAADRLAELRSKAVESGDSFLLRAVARTTGEAVARDEWRALAGAAEAAGKDRYAADARRQLESERE